MFFLICTNKGGGRCGKKTFFSITAVFVVVIGGGSGGGLATKRQTGRHLVRQRQGHRQEA